MITIARVVGAHGLKGELALALESDVIERFTPPLAVRLDTAPEAAAVITAFRRHGRLGLARLEGVSDRDQAKALIGRRLMVPEQERWPLPEGRFYVDDLIGLSVSAVDGRPLGQARRIWPGVAHDLLELDGGQLVPMVRAWLTVDLAARRIQLCRALEAEGDRED